MCPPDGDSPLLGGLLLSVALLAGCKSPAPSTRAPLQVAAAADLTLAFEELGKLFEARTGEKVTFAFGASGALAKQLQQGAPFDLFAAANTAFVDDAVASGACDGNTKALYARGHLVAWTKKGRPRLQSLSDLRASHIEHIAIANPEHAPYGRAAKEALEHAGLWPELRGKIVHAENVRQALQFAQTGNADVALVALSLVARSQDGELLHVAPSLHAPINQTLVVCKRGNNAEGARRFAELVASGEGQRLLASYGFAGSAEQARE